MDDLVAQLRAAVGDAFEVDRELGGGGMSRVFIATERSLDRKVVIKLLPPEFGDPVSAERFRREVTTIAKLQHPHIVPVLGTTTRNGLTWYVMPYVAGEALGERMKREGALPVDSAVTIMREVADALAHAHSLGVVHRDIKPANILLEAGHAVLADFGIASAMRGGNVAATKLTATGSSLGTVGYMSPEQLAPDGDVDARADIYALGVVGYEMLTGRPPFANLSGAALMAAHIRDIPPAPHTIRAEVPRAVSDVVMRALSKERDDRYPTAAAMRDALAPVSAQKPPMSRNRVLAIAGVAVAVIALAGWLGSRALGNKALDNDQIAVAPFDVLAPDLALWKDGMVDVLSRNLDGMGPLRSAPPSLVLKAWSGRADAASARALGERVAAKLVVIGTLQSAGKDSVRATALIIDAGTGRSIADVETRGETARMDQLADTLTVRLVSALSQVRPVGAARLASIGSRSLPAIKEFLQGEQFWRLAQWDSARAHYDQARALDSGFALPLSRIANAIGWTAGIGNQEATALQLRAARLNHGLAPRDSMKLLGDSLSASVSTPSLAKRADALKRLNAITRDAITRYPQDADAWYARGEVLFHYGYSPEVAAAPGDPRDAFDHAVALDSNFVPAYPHLAEGAMEVGDLAGARRYFTALKAHGGAAMSRAADLGLFFAASKRPGDAEIKALADTVSLEALASSNLMVRTQVDPDGAWLRFSHAFLASANAHKPEFSAQAGAFGARAPLATASRGKFAAYDSLRGTGGDNMDALRALAGVGAAERVAAQFDATLLEKNPNGANTYWAAVYLAEHGDVARIARLKEYVQIVEKRAPAPGSPPAAVAAFAEQVAAVKAVNEALRLQAAHDTAGALRAYAALPSFGGLPQDELLFGVGYAGLLAGAGHHREALALMNRFPDNGQSAAPLLALRRAQIAEAAGDKAAAIDAWAYVANAWAVGDPSVQPVVKQARDALTRLGAPDRAPTVQVKRQ